MSDTTDLERKLNSIVAQVAVLNIALAATVSQLPAKKRAAVVASFNGHTESLMASMLNATNASDAFLDEIQTQSRLFRNILAGSNDLE